MFGIRSARFAFGMIALLLVSCAGQAPAAPRAVQDLAPEQPATHAGPKVLTLAISTTPTEFSALAVTAPTGGWAQITEIHSDALITSEPGSRKRVGRLSENVPSLNDGTI